ncbi:MAG: OmpA family protein [Ignavibacteriae bacterium]|nr:OmpA family protein [Ignavibacteriota bacterium]
MISFAVKRIFRHTEYFIIFLYLAALHNAFSQEYDLSPGNKIVLRTEAFQSDSDSLDKAMIASLNNIGAYLQTRNDLKIEVSGHCDSTGKPEYNQELAIRRANKVRDFLISNFEIRPSNISARGYGSSKPVAENTTSSGRAKNRRVEIKPLTSLTKRSLTDENNKPTNEEGVLSFFNGAVQTKAPWNIGFGDAFISEPIYELHKINTKTESRAEVTFNDNSRLQVGENSLVIVYGLQSKEPVIKEKGNIELVKGDLLAKLRAIEREQEYVVKTPSAEMSFNVESKSKLAVDKSDRSTVSVFEGKTEVTAAGQSIEVPENFGTQVYRDLPPEPPRRLPDAPIILTPYQDYLPWSKDGVTFAWETKSVSAKLEISTDTNFNTIIWSVTTRKTLSKVNLDGGVYYWHMQGIDSVGLEGKPTAIRTLTIKKYNYDRARLNLFTFDEGVTNVDEPEALIGGTTDPHTIVKINGERLFIQSTGEFFRQTKLLEGRNTFIIEARDSIGFEESKTVILNYSPTRRFGVTFGFSPLVVPDKYEAFNVGAMFSLKLPQLFSSNSNFGMNLAVGEFIVKNTDTLQINKQTKMRGFGLAELLLRIEPTEPKGIVPFMEVTSGMLLWPNYYGDNYKIVSGGAYVAGLGIGLRSNSPSKAFGVMGHYRWITNDYKRFDPAAANIFHGMFDLQLEYYIY